MTDISRRPLGELERAVMDVVWHLGSATVHDASNALAERALAYSTLMTTLDRLHKKGLLDRSKEGHAFRYTPHLDRDAYERRLVQTVLEDLPAASKEAILSGFLDFAAADDALLDALEQQIAARRREQP